jgi:hypothetical protein
MRGACAFLALLLGCGGSNGGSVVPPPETCPARFAPVTLVEPVRHVGDGTAASWRFAKRLDGSRWLEGGRSMAVA